MGLEVLTTKEFKKYKDTIDFLAKFGLTIEDLIELKNIKEELKNANLKNNTYEEEKIAKLEKLRNEEKENNELNAKGKPTANDVISMFAQNGEKEGFYPYGRNS